MDGFSEKRCVGKKRKKNKEESLDLDRGLSRFIIARFRSLNQRGCDSRRNVEKNVIVMYRVVIHDVLEKRKEKKGIRGKGDHLLPPPFFSVLFFSWKKAWRREMIETRGLSGILPLYGGDTAARRKNREETCRATLICERLRAPGVPRCPPRDKETLAPA